MTADLTLPTQRAQTEHDTCVPHDPRGQTFGGLTLVAIGLLFLMSNLGLLPALEWRYVWPVALIALGVLVLAHRIRS